MVILRVKEQRTKVNCTESYAVARDKITYRLVVLVTKTENTPLVIFFRESPEDVAYNQGVRKP
jgi:hypothetical protein